MHLPYKEYKAFITERARLLRKEQTPVEEMLWGRIRNRQLNGKKFVRQHPILFTYNKHVDFFIVDFYCHEYKLIIELDGSIHARSDVKERDSRREQVLRSIGYIVMRFQNEEILNFPETVCSSIRSFLCPVPHRQ